MAPASNPAKGLQQNRPRPTVPRPIIPAIPLPYVQKRKQQEAARAKAREEAAAAVVEPPTSPQPKLDENTKIVNGSEDQESNTKEEPTEPAVASTPPTPAAPVARPVEEVEVVEEKNTVVRAELSSHEGSEGRYPNPLLLQHVENIANLSRRFPTRDPYLSLCRFRDSFQCFALDLSYAPCLCTRTSKPG